MKHASTVTYLHGDHLGSTSVASTQTGTLASRQTYYAFGTPRASDVAQITTITDYTFTGQRADSSDGLMYYGARYYDSAIGRFTQPDSIIPNQYNPQSLNRYAYVVNNPLKYKDPTGHMFTVDDLNGGATQEFDDPPPPPGTPPPGTPVPPGTPPVPDGVPTPPIGTPTPFPSATPPSMPLYPAEPTPWQPGLAYYEPGNASQFPPTGLVRQLMAENEGWMWGLGNMFDQLDYR